MHSKLWILSIVVMLCGFTSSFGQTTNINFEQFSGPSVFTGVQPPLTVGTATFSGGQVLSATTFLPADPTVVYGTSSFCPGCLPTLTIDFSKPVSNFSIFVANGQTFIVSYTVQDDQGGTQTLVLFANFDSGAGTFSLPSKNIRRVVISSSTSQWDFFIDNVRFDECSTNVTNVSLATNENCDPNISPNCQPNIVRADATETSDVAVAVTPAQAADVDLTADFGDLPDVTTDSNGKAISTYKSGSLTFGNTSTTVANLGAKICAQDFSNLTRVFNYNGFNFHQSLVSNTDFVNSTAMDAAAIQAFFVSHGSFLAQFILVGRVGGYLDTNGNGKLDAGEPTYSASGGTVPLHAGGKSAAEVFADNAVGQGINPKVLLATAEKENSLISKTTLPSAAILNFALGCGQVSDFSAQIQCGAKTLIHRFGDTTVFGRPISYPFFFHASDGVKHNVTGLGRQPVGFAVNTAATYAQYRYTPFIQSQPTGGGVFLFEKIWVNFGF
jgi:hypothetical protein